MQPVPPASTVGLTIGEAERFLGVPSPTLRSWERRYGLPTTARSTGSHRRYRAAELTQLGLMRDEVAIGRRASDAARRVRGMLDVHNPGAARVEAFLAASGQLDPGALRAVLDLARDELGLPAALDEVVMPAMRQIGAWWETGDCDVGQEHLTTEVVRGWLAKIVTVAPTAVADRRIVLLATGPGDFHSLGLEALAALLAQEQVGSRLLGSRTTQRVLLAAVTATTHAVVVVVSHLSSQRRSAVASLDAVSQIGCQPFFAGNAFLFATSRRSVPGTYLGESLAAAARTVAAASRLAEDPNTRGS